MVMKRWSVVPQRDDKITYVVPMTPAASAAQVAMMQNRHLVSRAHHAMDEVHDKADRALDLAADAQEQINTNAQNRLQNQGVMFLLIACFIIMFIILK